MLDVRLTESTPLVEAASGAPTTRRFRARLIEGDVQGSSGYYPAEMLRRDGPSIFKAGLHVFADHPGVTESMDRPERSIKDLAGRLATDARYDGDGLYAEVEVFPQYAPVIEAMADAIGMSIRAFGTAEASTEEGVRGPVITALTEGISVDFVTAAGAGGKIVELLESARAATLAARTARPLREGRNVGHYFESRIHHHFTGIADGMFGEGKLTRDERIGLSKGIGDGLDAFTNRVQEDHPQLYERDIYDGPPDENGSQVAEAVRRRLREGHGLTANELSSALADAVRENYGGDQIYTWVRDYTDEWVVFTVEDDTDCDLYQQGYTIDEQNQEVALSGEPVEVVARTTYVPAPPDPDDQEEPTQPAGGPLAEATKKKEGTMPELTEAEAHALQEAKDKAETELAEARAELEKERAKVAEAGDVTTRLDALDQALKESKATNLRLENDRTARTRCAEALKTSGLPDLSHARVTESVCRTLPTVEGAALDDAKLTEAINAAVTDEATYVAALAEASGAGAPRGLGAAPEPLTEADLDAELEKSLRGIGMSESSAKVAAAGR